MYLYLALTALLLSSFSLKAAEFKISSQSTWQHSIHMTGNITDGDADHFRNLIKNNPEAYILSDAIVLESSGGSVSEAARLAEEIERSGLAVRINDGGKCLSSCFLLVVAGQYRLVLSSGEVGLHRPYFQTEEYVFDNADYSRDVQEATFIVRSYLEARAVPSYLIDHMMSLPSSEIYTLTPNDIVRLGAFSPLAEELAISKCGVSNSNNLSIWQNGDFLRVRCIFDEVLEPMKYGYLDKMIGVEATIEAVKRAHSARTGGAGG